MKNYFKKFSIMFVMLLAVIGVGMIQNDRVANAATVGQQLLQPESGWKRYDDNDSSINYLPISAWGTDTNSNLYSGGTVHGTGIFTRTGNNGNFGAYVTFKFSGTKLRILSWAHPSYSSNCKVTIDGIVYTFSIDGADSQILAFEKTQLSNGIHTVRIDQGTNGLYQRLYIDAIDIDDNGYLVNPNESISLNKSIDNLQVWQTDNLVATITPAAQVTWTSSDTSIATVDSTGKVTAVKEGQATITATTTDGSNLNSACTVNVTNPVISGITLNKTSDSLSIGQTDNLVATTTPANAQIAWSSSDSSIATVDQTGKITAIKAGTVIITANTSGGVTTTCTVIVANTTGGNTIPTNPIDNSGGTSTGTTNIVNIAHAKGDNTNNAGGEVSIIFNGLPDTTLSVVKTADVKSVYVGDTFTYTIVVTNTGAKTAKSVVINDSAPNHIQFMPSGITTTQGTVDSNSTSSNILVNVGDIPPLGTVTIKIPATVIL